jgi:hypothetical protein
MRACIHQHNSESRMLPLIAGHFRTMLLQRSRTGTSYAGKSSLARSRPWMIEAFLRAHLSGRNICWSSQRCKLQNPVLQGRRRLDGVCPCKNPFLIQLDTCQALIRSDLIPTIIHRVKFRLHSILPVWDLVDARNSLPSAQQAGDVLLKAQVYLVFAD